MLLLARQGGRSCRRSSTRADDSQRRRARSPFAWTRARSCSASASCSARPARADAPPLPPRLSGRPTVEDGSSSRSRSAASSSSASRTSCRARRSCSTARGSATPGPATSPSSAAAAAARASSACSAGRRDRGRARGAARRAAARGRSSSRTRCREPTLEGRVDLRDQLTFTIDPETAKDFDDAHLGRARGRRLARVGAHRGRLRTSSPAGTPLDRGAAERAFSTYVPGLVAPMLPPELADDALQPAAARGPPLRHGRDAVRRRARAAASRPSTAPSSAAASGSRTAQAEAILAGRERTTAELGEALALAERLRHASCASGGSRAARCASRRAEIDVRVRRPRRRRRRALRGRAARAHARRGADDPRQRSGRRPARRAAARGALPRPRAARPAGDRCCCSASSPTSACRRRRRRTTTARRRRRRARWRPRSAERRDGVRRGSGRGARGVSRARAALARSRRATTRANLGHSGPRQPGVLPLHVARSAATRTSSCHRALLRELGRATNRPARRPRRSSPSTPRRASARRRRSSTSPTSSASRGCSNARLFERGWEEPCRGRDHRR